jgi:transposase
MERKHYSAEEKVAILRRQLLDKVPVPDLCEELGLRPTVFYRLAKGVLRERSGCLSGSGPSPPSGGGEAETDSVLGEEGADQRRSPGRVDGGARRAKKKLGEL